MIVLTWYAEDSFCENFLGISRVSNVKNKHDLFVAPSTGSCMARVQFLLAVLQLV